MLIKKILQVLFQPVSSFLYPKVSQQHVRLAPLRTSGMVLFLSKALHRGELKGLPCWSIHGKTGFFRIEFSIRTKVPCCSSSKCKKKTFSLFWVSTTKLGKKTIQLQIEKT